MPTDKELRDTIVSKAMARVRDRKPPTQPQQTDIVSEARERVATPPASVACVRCGEQIYLSLDRWYHLNSGGRNCPPPPSAEADHD